MHRINTTFLDVFFTSPSMFHPNYVRLLLELVTVFLLYIVLVGNVFPFDIILSYVRCRPFVSTVQVSADKLRRVILTLE